jgi:hypothetical protein
VFAWAPFRSTKAAIKLHTLLDLRGNIPSFIRITDGKTHEVNTLDDLVLEAGAFYLMDRGYLDFAVLIAIAKKRLHLAHHSLYEILQILSLSLFETIPINQLRTPPSTNSELDFELNQLALL